jgi:hypothetical protein
MAFNFSENVSSEHRREVLTSLRSSALAEIFRNAILIGVDPSTVGPEWTPDSAGFDEGSVVRDTAESIKGHIDRVAMIERLLLEIE